MLCFKVIKDKFLLNLRGFTMTQRDLAGILGINVKTLRKWKKDRPKVYKLLMIGLKAETMIAGLKENIETLEQLIQDENFVKSEVENPERCPR